MLDIIGDIHGYSDHLEKLLQKLGYKNTNGYYSHPDENRSVLFIGDFIDRGPKIKETLELVKAMVDHGSAKALMGNHEYNAILFHMKHPNGGHLRKHSIQNIGQHYYTLMAFKNNQKEYEAYIEWFKTLPLFYEEENFRAVHAAWDYDSIDYLKTRLEHNRLSEDLLVEAADKTTKLYDAIEVTLKGKEMALPEGESFKDSDDNVRNHIRIKWWVNQIGMDYQSIAVHPSSNIPTIKIKEEASFYDSNDKPIFFGHYWLKGEPNLYQNNICCVDYSVAKEGYLVAYTYNGEAELDNSKFTSVKV